MRFTSIRVCFVVVHRCLQKRFHFPVCDSPMKSSITFFITAIERNPVSNFTFFVAIVCFIRFRKLFMVDRRQRYRIEIAGSLLGTHVECERESLCHYDFASISILGKFHLIGLSAVWLDDKIFKSKLTVLDVGQSEIVKPWFTEMLTDNRTTVGHCYINIASDAQNRHSHLSNDKSLYVATNCVLFCVRKTEIALWFVVFELRAHWMVMKNFRRNANSLSHPPNFIWSLTGNWRDSQMNWLRIPIFAFRRREQQQWHRWTCVTKFDKHFGIAWRVGFLCRFAAVLFLRWIRTAARAMSDLIQFSSLLFVAPSVCVTITSVDVYHMHIYDEIM